MILGIQKCLTRETRHEMALTLMYITNNSNIALIAEKYGVDRIWIDLETIGKEKRQRGMNTVKSKHSIDDIRRIKPLLSDSELMVRVNPWNDSSSVEINQVIEAGADVVMLPMWKNVDEVKNFVKSIGGRAKTNILLETKDAAECIEEVLGIDGIDEVHIGLNDLHLSYGLTFMFELLTNGIVENLCKKIKAANIPYGFGGIAKIGEGMLPAEKIVLEHYRLGSTCAILSRSFCNTDEIRDIDEIEKVFSKNMKELREYEKQIQFISDEELIDNMKEVKHLVQNIVDNKRQTA